MTRKSPRKPRPWYPPSPDDVPLTFTQPPPYYRLQAGLLLLSLMLFFCFYLFLLGASGWYLYGMWLTPIMPDTEIDIFVKVLLSVMDGMLFLFLLKNLFRFEDPIEMTGIEIEQGRQPDFFRFLEKLCDETGAPTPNRVFVDASVNAAVVPPRTIWGMLTSHKKDLVIGLGLVETLNRSELKAVLAHELGHFSQKSTQLGSYAYVANKIMADMIWRRDWWDDILDMWCSIDIRLAIFGWFVAFVIWLFRQVMGLFIRLVGLINAGLSRQMEFSADRFAICAAGSDAICHALYKMPFAELCLEQSLQRVLHEANTSARLTNDLFLHQREFAGLFRKAEKRPEWGIPPNIPPGGDRNVRIFAADHEPSSMWSSHPPSQEREEAAKNNYFYVPPDTRTAWGLFTHPHKLRQQVTHHFWKKVRGPQPFELTDAKEIQESLEEDFQEDVYDDIYHDAYHLHDPVLKHPQKLMSEILAQPPLDVTTLKQRFDALYDDTLAGKMAQFREAQQEQLQLLAVLTGQVKGKTFSFRDTHHPQNHAGLLFEEVNTTYQNLQDWLGQWDKEVLSTYLSMAADLKDDQWMLDLVIRYDWMMTIQELSELLTSAHSRLESPLEVLASPGNLDVDSAQMIIDDFADAHDMIKELLTIAKEAKVPPLKLLDGGNDAASYLLPEPLIGNQAKRSYELDGYWIQSFLVQVSHIEEQLQRLRRKSLSQLLQSQEQLANQWHLHHNIGPSPFISAQQDTPEAEAED